LARGEVQSVEVSCLIHATEDDARVRSSITGMLSVESTPQEEPLQGHFGNSIVHVTWHLTGDDASAAFGRLAQAIGEEGRKEVLRDLGSMTDEHGALYLRLNKQMLVKGTAVFSMTDPVRVRVKPRRFMMKGTPEQFYARLLGVVGR
jgi:RNA binding exosome subunit